MKLNKNKTVKSFLFDTHLLKDKEKGGRHTDDNDDENDNGE